MFGKKRKQRSQDENQASPPETPQPSPTPRATPPAEPSGSSGASFDHRPAPPQAPPSGPMMSHAYAMGAKDPSQPLPDRTPLAVKAQTDDEPASSDEPAPSKAAREAEQTIARIEASLADLARAHNLQPLTDQARPLDERLSTIADRLHEEHQRFTEIDNERLNAVGMLQEAQQRLESLQREFDEASTAHERGDDEHRAEMDERLRHLEHELGAARETIGHLERDRDEARHALEHAHAHDPAIEERIHALEGELHTVRESLAHTERERDEARTELDTLRERTQDDARAQEQLEELTRAITEMEERVANAEAREQELTRQSEASRDRAQELEAQLARRAEHEIGPDAFCELRRARLGRVRTALRARSAKLYKVKQALEQKAQDLKDASEIRRQAEQALFEAREQRAMTERVYIGVQRMRAKGTTGMFLGGLAIAWVALAGASWMGVSAFVPVEHNAHTAIACDTRGLPEPYASAASWTEFALALAQDPMFLERAAQRMKTRAYDELASPADLGAFLASNAIIDSPAPGRVNVTLRGEGRDRTQRVLETLATSVVAFANETRERRADGAPSAVIEPASAESQPVDDPRPAIAAGVAGGMTALLLIGAVGAWRSARKAVAESGREALRELDAHTQSHYETPPARQAEGV
ncbi:MAG: hypothetical protein Tsb0013_17930 [Phycisphaerales bacterium]